MIKDLISLANKLDKKGLRKEADYLDKIIRKISSEEDSKYFVKNKTLYAEKTSIGGEIICAKWISDDRNWELCDSVPDGAMQVELPPIIPAFESLHGFE